MPEIMRKKLTIPVSWVRLFAQAMNRGLSALGRRAVPVFRRHFEVNDRVHLGHDLHPFRLIETFEPIRLPQREEALDSDSLRRFPAPRSRRRTCRGASATHVTLLRYEAAIV